MIVRTEIKEQANGDIMTVQYDENEVPVKFGMDIKAGGRIRCEIMNPDRWHTAVDKIYQSYKFKMKMQSDAQMRVYEDYTVRKHAQLANEQAKKNKI